MRQWEANEKPFRERRPMELTPCETMHGFTVRTASDLPEIDGRAYVLDHNASGAQLLPTFAA